MLALVLVLAATVLLLAVLVAGLLRSHADILRALHDLGAGVGDPAAARRHRTDSPGPQSVPVTLAPLLPAERSSTSAPPIAGVTPSGDALAVDPATSGQLTLVAFLSSGCATCAGIWRDLSAPGTGLPEGTQVLVVTKGPEMEISGEVGARGGPALRVIMSTQAWSDYEVPGSPFFALIDGRNGRRIGEGVAAQLSQVVDMVRRAAVDAEPFGPASAPPSSRGRALDAGLDGPARELDNDRALTAAGIPPGHPSLYPESLADIMAPPRPPRPAARGGRGR